MAELRPIGYPYDVVAIADLNADGRNDVVVIDRLELVMTTFLNQSL